jgi:predicted transcriptional regulator
VFSAVLGREAVLGRKLRRLAERFYRGSLGPLLTHLVRSRGLTAEECRQLRALLDAADRRAARDRTGRRLDAGRRRKPR